MEGTKKNGGKVWIYWPDQCKLCTGYINPVNGKPCAKEKTERFIKELRKLEHGFPGVYGKLEFKCDYFCVDEEKLKTTPPYSDLEAGCCSG